MESSAFGPYRILDKLGVGGMAVVYKAVDGRSEQVVALKVLHAHWAVQPDIVHRFQREADLARRLRHPHIVPVLDSGVLKNRPYLTMQYMSHGSLADRFAGNVALSLHATSRLLEQISGALDYAHGQGVIHRDLKLENILLDEERRPHLSDFGLARVAQGTRLTMTGNITGTPRYMAPEQARGLPDIDYRVDLYAFAVMAYLLATGFFPFTADDPLALLNQHLYMTPPLPTRVNPTLPLEMDTVLLKGMSKQAEDRYQSASEFATAFDEAVAGNSANRTTISIVAHNPINPASENALAQTVEAVKVVTPPPPRRRRRGPLLAAILVIVLVAAAFTLVQTSGILSAGTSATVTPTESGGAVQFVIPTDTPEPTATSTPTESVTVTDTPLPGNAVVTGESGVNMRQGAGTNFSLIIILNQGTPLTLIGRNSAASWLQAQTIDERFTGWVFGPLVEAHIDVMTLPVTWLDTPVPPTSAATSIPPPTQPAPTSAPPPTATNVPPPTSTRRPAPTSSPRPAPTNTPRPLPTNTPRPLPTNTPRPVATNTAAPSINLPLPTVTTDSGNLLPPLGGG